MIGHNDVNDPGMMVVTKTEEHKDKDAIDASSSAGEQQKERRDSNPVLPVPAPPVSAPPPVPKMIAHQRGANAAAFDPNHDYSPLMREMVSTEIPQTMTLPQVADDQSIAHAFSEMQLELTTSSFKRNRMITKAREREKLQRDFQLAFNAQRKLHVPMRVVSMADAVKLTDRDLINNFSTYSNSNPYLTARYVLITNRYYSLVPIEMLNSLSRADLLERVRQLYNVPKNQRNEELIRFYQAAIVIRDEKEAAKKGQRMQPPAKNLPSYTDLDKKNGEFSKKNSDYLNKNLLLTQAERTERLLRMESVMRPADQASSWRGTDASLTNGQREGLREILAWMYRNCNKTSESKFEFVHKIAGERNDRLLFMFYMIENDMVGNQATPYITTALTDYVPSLDKVKDKLVASKFKFWKRIGTNANDSVVDWAKLGSAARIALKNVSLDENHEYTEKIKSLELELNNPKYDRDFQKRNILLDMVHAKGNYLLSLYRSAGLSPNMPIELIQDHNLRRKITDLLGSFNQSFAELVQIVRTSGIGASKNAQTLGNYATAGREVARTEKDEENSGEAEETLESINALFYGGDLTALGINATTQSVLGIAESQELAEKSMEAIMESGFGGAYVGATGSLVGVVSILTIITSIMKARELDTAHEALSVADHTAQALGVSGEMIEGFNAMTEAVSEMVYHFGHFDAVSRSIGVTKAAAESTASATTNATSVAISAGLQIGCGVASAVAGGLQLAAASVQLGRAVSSRTNIEDSREKLKSRTQDQSLSKEQRRDMNDLSLFLQHQDRMTDLQRNTAIVSMISGGLKVVGGIINATGVLAPVGTAMVVISGILDIGFGLLYARHKKKQNRLKSVDEAMGLDKLVTNAKQNLPANIPMTDEELYNLLRQKILGEMGYATFNEYYADICMKNAELLYKHVFRMPKNDPDYKMYLEALKSLGTKLRIPADGSTEKPFPTVDVIYAKLME